MSKLRKATGGAPAGAPSRSRSATARTRAPASRRSSSSLRRAKRRGSAPASAPATARCATAVIRGCERQPLRSPPPCGEGSGVGVVDRRQMTKHDEPRTWAIRDRARAPRQRDYARSLRANPTDAEQKLWWHLRRRLATTGTHFRRQVQIGRYVADFVNHKAKLVIEVD